MWVPPPVSQESYDIGKALQQDRETGIEHREELREARGETARPAGRLWARVEVWVKARLSRPGR